MSHLAISAIKPRPLSAQGVTALVSGNQLFHTNLAVGGLSLMGTMACFLLFTARLFQARCSGKRWTRSRWRSCWLSYTQLAEFVVAQVGYLLPNGAWFAGYCELYTPSVGVGQYLQLAVFQTMFVSFCVRAHGLLPLSGDERPVPWLPLYNRFASREQKRRDAADCAYVEDLPLWAHLDKVWKRGSFAL